MKEIMAKFIERLSTGITTIGTAILTLPVKTIQLLSQIPSTNLRIVVTMGVVVGTAVKYWNSYKWVPSTEWLTFLAVMAGIDTLQYASKRMTFGGVDTQKLPKSDSDKKKQTTVDDRDLTEKDLLLEDIDD